MANAGFPPHRYLPIDKAPRLPGTLKGDITGDNSVLRRVPIADFDCIDIDTYGEPWEPWLRWVAPRLARERTTIVLLTCGRISLGGGTSVSAFSKRLAGIPDDWAITRHPAVAQYLGDFTIRQSAVVAEIEAAAQIVLPRVTYFALLARGRTALPA